MTRTRIEALPTTGLVNPYVGPQPFSRRDHRYFRGRERETNELGDLLAARRLVLFYAESGAGKTSLINAGLRPLLERREFEVLPVARVAGAAPEGVTPDNIYAFNVMAAIDRNRHAARHFAGLALTDFLLDLEPTEGEFDRDAEAGPPDEDALLEIPRRVLIIDQFEELFTTQAGAAGQAAREDFMGQIARAMADDPYLYVLLSMRADYVHHLSRLVHLLPDGLDTRYYMSRMRPAEALWAVAEPALAAGRSFDEGVAEELVERLARERNQTAGGDGEEWARGETVEPVQLQVVCYQLWESVAQSDGDGPITRDDLNRVARSMAADGAEAADPLAAFIDSALGSFYEQTLAEALRVPEAGITEPFLRDWFSGELITEAGTRGFVLRGDDETAGVPEAVLAVLLARHLVRSETRAGAPWVELVHDTFITPVRQANDAWLQRGAPWIAAAYRWAERGRPANELLVGELLESALAEAGDPAGLADTVRAFLAESAKAEKERKAAEELARVRTVRRFAGAMGVLATVALIAAVAAVVFGLQARTAQATSETAQVAAEAAQAAAETAQAAAEAARVTSEFNAVEARSAQAQAEELKATSDFNAAKAEENKLAAEAGATALQNEIYRVTGALSMADAAIAVAESLTTPTIQPTGTVEIPGVEETHIIDPTENTSTTFPTSSPTRDNSQDTLADIKATRAAFSELPVIEEIGTSAGGRPINVTKIGSGPKVFLLVNGITGGFAPSSTYLADSTIDYFSRFPNEIPAGISLHIISILNPDAPISPGQIQGRLNANGVDIIRNFDCTWSRTNTFRGADISNGSGPFSEPESEALRNYILNIGPAAVIFTGARATPSLVNPGLCNGVDSGSVDLAAVYAGDRDFQLRTVVISGTGDPSDWVTTLGIPSIFVLLRQYNTLSDDELKANLSGLKAVLNAQQ